MPIPVIISTLVTMESTLFLLKKQKLATYSSSQYKIYIQRENIISKQTLCYSISAKRNNTEVPRPPLKICMKLPLTSAGTQHTAKKQDVAS